MVQIPLFTPTSDWVAPKVSDLPSWEGAARVAVDVETCDPQLKKLGCGVRRDGRVVGISFAIQYRDLPDKKVSEAPAFYLPIGHQGGGNLDPVHVWQYLKDQAQVFRGDVVGANLQYDLDYLAENEVEFNPRFFRDVQIAEPLIYELHNYYSLAAIARYNDLEGKDETMLEKAAKAYGVDTKAELWKLPSKFVGRYGEIDARLPLEIIVRQERKIEALDREDENGARLWDLYDLESRCLPALLAMRRRGVRIDFDQLDRVAARASREQAEACKEMSRLAGRNIQPSDLNKEAVVGPAIEDAIGRLPRTKTGKIQLQQKHLESMQHPVVDAFLRAKRYAKVQTTYVESIRKHEVRGRIHTTFNQLRRTEDGETDSKGTISGRLSAVDPNLQNQPARDPIIGPMWRAIYVPDEGGTWACLDFSQQEPRWLVHFAEKANCTGSKLAADRYRENPFTDNHDMMTIMIHGQAAWDSWDKAERKQARGACKVIYLGLCYSMGGAKLAHELGLPTLWKEHWKTGRVYEAAGEEAQAILDRFDAKVPFIKELARRAEKVAAERGYIRTVLGRRCHFPPAKEGPGYDWTHKALNRLIQGSSADQTKKATVLAHEEGFGLQIQVHDELDLTIYSMDEANRVAEIMRDCVPCNVPHRVDIETGPNWGNVKEAV